MEKAENFWEWMYRNENGIPNTNSIYGRRELDEMNGIVSVSKPESEPKFKGIWKFLNLFFK